MVDPGRIVPFPEGSRDSALATGGGGDDSGGMEVRISRLDDSLGRIGTDLAYLKGKVEGLPSTCSMITTIVAGNLGLAGLTWAIPGRK